MNHCLDDRALLLAAIGEADAEERAHLSSCRSCTRRSAEVMSDLDVIGRALREVPPRLTSAPAPHRAGYWWVAALATAALVALIAAPQWLRRPAPIEVARVSEAPAVAAPSWDVRVYAQEVSAAMFDTAADRRLSSDIFGVAAHDGQGLTSETDALQEALEAGPVCTGARFINDDCNDYVSALFF
jgi:hypothetical protein